MKSFKNQAAQGDLLIRRISCFPENVSLASHKNGNYIVAHSETGHNHVIVARPNVSFYTGYDPMVSYLQIVEAADMTETILEHLRGFDTHESISIPIGLYEIRRQREYIPEGWRRVED